MRSAWNPVFSCALQTWLALAMTTTAAADCGPFDGYLDQNRACPTSWTTCPNSGGRVVANWNFEFNGDLIDHDQDGASPDPTPMVPYLDDCELQCAIDCLDGDPDQEREPRAQLFVPPIPEPIPGGRLVLDARIHYRLRQGVRLPLRSLGPVHVEGNGATLWVEPADYAALSRPVVGNACDAADMRAMTASWLIEDLVFETLHPGTTSGRQLAISIHGATGLTLRNIAIRPGPARPALGLPEWFDIGVALTDCQDCFLDRLNIALAAEHDIVLAPPGLDGRPDASTWAPAWPACAGARPAADAGCHGTTVWHPRHVASFGQPASIWVHGSNDVRIMRASFEGALPEAYVHRTGPANVMTVRDNRLEVFTQGTEEETTLPGAYYLNESGGLFRIDGGILIPLPGPSRTFPSHDVGLLYDSRAAPDSLVTTIEGSRLIRSGGPGSGGVQLAVGVRQSLAVIDHRGLPGISVADPAYWLGPPPLNLAELSARGWRLPSERQEGEKHGELWSSVNDETGGDSLWTERDSNSAAPRKIRGELFYCRDREAP